MRKVCTTGQRDGTHAPYAGIVGLQRAARGSLKIDVELILGGHEVRDRLDAATRCQGILDYVGARTQGYGIGGADIFLPISYKLRTWGKSCGTLSF